MNEKLIIQSLKEYNNGNVYLNILKKKIENNEKLNATHLKMAETLLISESGKTQNIDTLKITSDKITGKDVKEKLKEILWDKYKKKQPYDYQKYGISWLTIHHRGIIADDMGLGKTLQLIIASIEVCAEHVLICTPNTLKFNWLQEMLPFISNEEITIANNNNFEFIDGVHKYLIINYEKLDKNILKLKKIKFDTIIADEAHYIKNANKSKRGKAFLKITKPKYVNNVWLSTGTPVTTDPMSYFYLLKAIHHPLTKDKWKYGMRYCDGRDDGFGYKFDGATNLKELHIKTRDFILRRKKEDVLSLPKKQSIPVYLKMSKEELKKQKKFVASKVSDSYKKLIDDGVDEYEATNRITKAESMIIGSANRMYSAILKVDNGYLFEIIDNAFENNKNIVIFSNYTVVLDKIKDKYDETLIIDGRVKKAEDRMKIVNEYNTPNNKRKIIALNYAVGNVGLTLTMGNFVIMNDLPWVPTILSQSQDRVYRIGQKQNVIIYYPIYENSIERYIYEVLTERLRAINKIVDNEDESFKLPKRGDIVNEIFRKYKKNVLF